MSTMAHSRTDHLYPAAEIPKRHTPWFIQLMVAFAVLVLAAVVYGFWQMGKMPARTLELPTIEKPAAPANNPPQERPQRPSPLPTPLAPLPTPATP
jgi:hypothetical protein